MRIPMDEIGIVASLREAPLPLVKCVTNDILVPADAEYVLEGYIDELGYREAEGPYGEFLGYYGGVKRNPVFHLTAVTHRRDPMFQTMTISGPTMGYTDTSPLIALRTEAMIWRALEGAVREPVAVYATGASGGMFNVRIALRQRVPGEARNAIAAAFASLANIKNVFVVDPDVDIFSDQQMDWALATRFQAKRDMVIEDGFRALPLDPSLGPDRLGSKAGFDLTWPFGAGGAFDRQVPCASPPTTASGSPRSRWRCSASEVVHGIDGRRGQSRRPRDRATARGHALGRRTRSRCGRPLSAQGPGRRLKSRSGRPPWHTSASRYRGLKTFGSSPGGAAIPMIYRSRAPSGAPSPGRLTPTPTSPVWTPRRPRPRRG